MKILVTGGAGFIGSHLCDALRARGDSVCCVDDLSLGRRANVAHLVGRPGFRLAVADLLERGATARIFRSERFDAVCHLAANSDIRRGGVDHSVDLRRTFRTTLEVLEHARRRRIRRFFFASTSAVFGETSDVLHEDYGPLKPISFYGASKLASEAFLSVYANNYGLDAQVLRFPNVVGARCTHGAVHDFIRRLRRDPRRLRVLGDGRQEKPYLHVSDLVEAILRVRDRAPRGYAVYHAGARGLTTVRGIARMVLEEMGLPKARLEYTGGDRGWVGDVPRFRYDDAKLRRLGWRPRYSSGEAVRRAIRDILGKP